MQNGDKGVSRRDFLKRATLVGAGIASAGALSACSSGTATSSEPTGNNVQWDKQADIVVVGSGGSAWGALRAAEAGASVILVEKSALFGGTCSLSGAAFWIPASSALEEKGIPDSKEDALTYLDYICEGKSSPEMQAMYVDRSNEWLEWTKTHGYEWEVIEYYGSLISDYYYPAAPGSTMGRSIWADLVTSTKNITGETIAVDNPYADRGPQTWKLLKHLCDEAGVDTMLSTEATKLIQDDNGEVIGIVAQDRNSEIKIGANKAVILGAGGMDHNPSMRNAFLRAPLANSMLVTTCTGDGHRMGMEIGAGLSNMPSFYGSSVFLPKDFKVGEDIMNDQNGEFTDGGGFRGGPGAIVVNRRGRRFANESAAYAPYARAYEGWDTGSMQWENLPSFFICDDAYVQSKAMPGQESPGTIPDWMYQADTLEELAQQLGIDPEGLVKQVAEFNENAKNGVDPVWDRPATSLATLETPPFYGAPQWVSSLGTAGGLDIDVNAQVLDVHGNPIPHLYAVGCNAASPFGSAYPAGGAPVASGSVMSYVAALHALSL